VAGGGEKGQPKRKKTGRKSYAETHPWAVFLAQKLRAERLTDGSEMSLRDIGDLLAKRAMGPSG
jgi:hypothetical protein